MDNHERNDIHIGCAMALVLGIIWILLWFAIYSILAAGMLWVLTLIAPTVVFSIKFVLIVGVLLAILRFIL